MWPSRPAARGLLTAPLAVSASAFSSSLDDLFLFSGFLLSAATTKTFPLTGTEWKRLSKQITFMSDRKQGLSSPRGSDSSFNATSRHLFHIESRRRIRAEI